MRTFFLNKIIFSLIVISTSLFSEGIVFVGDSHTKAKIFPKTMANLLNTKYIIEAENNAKVSAFLAKDLKRVIHKNAGVYFIWFGTNELNSGVGSKDYINSLKAMINYINEKDMNKDIILLNPLPFKDKKMTKLRNNYMNRLENVAKLYNNVKYLSLEPCLEVISYYDNAHLTNNSYRNLAKCLVLELKKSIH